MLTQAPQPERKVPRRGGRRGTELSPHRWRGDPCKELLKGGRQ